MPAEASSLVKIRARGAAGRIFLSQTLTGAGISLIGASGGVVPVLSSKEGRASRLIKPKKMASMTVVVRRHLLSLPLRKIMARTGESM